jgi:hypothetical protein
MDHNITLTESSTRAGAILREAATFTDGLRDVTHGDKERSFVAIAGLWDAYLAARPCGREGYMQASDVSALMVLLKFVRSQYGTHIEDHGVDACGYAAIWGQLRERSI